MRYHKITSPDIENGIGFRVTLWLSGCCHMCPGCQNPETHYPLSGLEFTEKSLKELTEKLSKSYIKGLTLSGGDPLSYSTKDLLNFLPMIKKRFPEKDIWLYTGYTYSEILEDREKRKILDFIDVLVDGRFLIEQRDISIAFRGSRNQRIINVQESLKKNKIITLI